MRQYLLAEHVRLGLSEGQAILLDLKNDRYLGLGRSESAALSKVILEWPQTDYPGGNCDAISQQDTELLVREMLDRQLIAEGEAALTRRRPAAALDAACAAVTPMAEPRVLKHTKNCLLGFLAASLKLKLLGLEGVIRSVAARKTKRATETQPDSRQLSELVAVFTTLRPLLFTARDACLFDSLALLEFLAKYKIYPTWVFGVVAAPFSAHSWLQYGGVVLNDYPENVLKYSPILVV
jgi:hypothetical protein